jgi:hypothetical protein
MGKVKKKLALRNKITDTDKKQNSYPVFCFKYLMDEPKCDPESRAGFYAEFITRLKKLSNLGWNAINVSGKHGFGYEKIPIDNIKPKNLPSIITPEIKDLVVFRATGDNRAFLGIRNCDIFHIVHFRQQ